MGPEGGRPLRTGAPQPHHSLQNKFVGRCERESGNWAGNLMQGWETAPETHCWSLQHVLEA